ncbi:MAG: hypothetical protein ABW184_16340 [Sphingobium sp.]
MDLLGSMMLSAPKFQDPAGIFPEWSIDTTFHSLDEGLKAVRKRVGEDNYAVLAGLSERMKAHFAADPEDKTGEADKGYACLREMEELLPAIARRKR